MNKKNKKTIVVNDIAATSAGAYTILENFLEELIINKASQTFNWVVFVSCEEFSRYNNDYIQIINVNSKNWLKRIYWDLFGLPNWVRNNKLDVYRIFSIQNTGVPFMRSPQYIYIHQPLILGKNIKLKSFEWRIKLFRFIYYYCVKWTIRKDSKIIVQTKWMKDELINQFKLKHQNILILKPKIKIDQINFKQKKKEFSYKLFYPAVPVVSYKNHELIIEAVSALKKLNLDLYKKIEILFTTDKEFNKLTSHYHQLSRKLNVESKIKWCGYLNQEQMNENYINSDLFLFPSKLESFGLPLIEAAFRDCSILALNTSFAKELLEDYEKVRYFENNSNQLAKLIDGYYKTIGIKNKRGKDMFKYIEDRSIIDVLME